MRISFLLSIVPLISLTLGLPVPGTDVSSLGERDLPLADGRAIEAVHVESKERRDSDGLPPDLGSRSGITSTQGQSLFKKDSGEHLEPRVIGAVVKVAKLAVEAIMAIVDHVKAKIEQEKEVGPKAPHNGGVTFTLSPFRCETPGRSGSSQKSRQSSALIGTP